MNNFRVITAVILLTACTVGAFGSPSVTLPEKTEQQRFLWKSRSIKIVVSSSLTKANPNIKVDSDVIGAIRRSFAAWQEVANIDFQIDVSDKQSVSPAGVSGDGVSLITIASTPENVLFFAKDAQTVSAKTRVFYNRKGFITEADIVLNPFQQFSTDGSFGTFDLQSALTHEIGHLLGLRHSSVMGSAMSENLAKNAAMGDGDFAPRTLSESDITAVRELYGVDKDNEDCCAAITGKITLQTGKQPKSLKVWAEESDTGRVTAQADAGGDGTFRIGGLSAGTYKILWRSKGGQAGTATGELGSLKVENGETKTINQKVPGELTKIALDYIGVNGQLAEAAVRVERGSEQTIFIGGKNLDPKSLSIDLNSPFIHVDANSLTERDFGDDISVMSFVVTVDPDAPKGVYSIFVADRNGVKTVLIGAIKVQ